MREVGPVAVLGDGAWGTALAMLLHGKGIDVRVWSACPDYAREVARTRHNVRYLPGVKVPRAIAWGSDLAQAVRGARVWVVAIPTQFIRSTFDEIKACLPTEPWICSVAKGIEEKTGPQCIIQSIQTNMVMSSPKNRMAPTLTTTTLLMIW